MKIDNPKPFKNQPFLLRSAIGFSSEDFSLARVLRKKAETYTQIAASSSPGPAPSCSYMHGF